MATEKQVLANRLNAQRSTGPRTAEGKANSRGNAIRHGLAGAGVALSETDHWAHTKRLKDWRDDIQPQGVVENWIVSCAVAASVRVDRCRRAEWAELERTRRERIQAWEDEQDERLQAILPENAREIGGVLCFLEQFSTGCEWLATTWKMLRGRFAQQGFFGVLELADMLSLLGLDPEKTCQPERQEQKLAQMNDCAREGGEGAAEARRALGARIDEQVKGLEELARARWGMEEARWLNEDIDSEAFDASPRGQLVHRYETASRNDVHRCLAQLARIRKEGVLCPQEPPSRFSSAPQPAAPTPAPAPEAAAGSGLRNEANSPLPVAGSSAVLEACVTQPSPAAARGSRSTRRAEEVRPRVQACEAAGTAPNA